MAIERNPNDPTRSGLSSNDELLRRRTEEAEAELQADPKLVEGPARGGRITLFAIAIVAVLGVVFYGLNSSNTTQETAPVAQTPPAGQTTGSATSPAQPPAAPQQNNPAPAAPQTNGAAQTNQ